ncbi:MAG: DnaJ family domain-containing protein [Chitinophagales bacterium]
MNHDEVAKDSTTWHVADKLSEKTLREDFPAHAKRTLHMIQQHDLVGAIMAKAIADGEFENLKGAGKPIELDVYPMEPMELKMVHKILKDNGYAPYWIELNKEINILRERMEKEIDSFKKYTQIVFSEKRSRLAMARYEQKKKNFYIVIRDSLEKISKKILDFNLNCPVLELGRSNFNVENEMNRIVEDIEKFIADQKAGLPAL